MKIRAMTKEELESIEVKQYDSGFSMWVIQPGLKEKRVILDASLFKETGEITVTPPDKWTGFKFGSIFTKQTIKLVAIV